MLYTHSTTVAGFVRWLSSSDRTNDSTVHSGSVFMRARYIITMWKSSW